MRPHATADRVLTAFFAEHRATAGADPTVLERTACDLRLCIEVTGERSLSADDAVLLAGERQFDAIGAVGRVLPVVGLLEVLQRFVVDPVYRPDSTAEARQRLEICAALLRRLAVRTETTGCTRLLRRVEEAIRVEAGALGPLRRLPVRRVRS